MASKLSKILKALQAAQAALSMATPILESIDEEQPPPKKRRSKTAEKSATKTGSVAKIVKPS